MDLIRVEDLGDFKLFGFTLKQLDDMYHFAVRHGWKAKPEITNG